MDDSVKALHLDGLTMGAGTTLNNTGDGDLVINGLAMPAGTTLNKTATASW